MHFLQFFTADAKKEKAEEKIKTERKNGKCLQYY